VKLNEVFFAVDNFAFVVAAIFDVREAYSEANFGIVLTFNLRLGEFKGKMKGKKVCGSAKIYISPRKEFILIGLRVYGRLRRLGTGKYSCFYISRNLHGLKFDLD
jgi:hypothetical protein